MPRVITWNMEGGTYDRESKWVTGVTQLMLKFEANYLCLQEAGPLPESSVPYGGVMPPWIGGGVPAGYGWAFHSWKAGRETVYILWLHTGAGANKVNLAIVTPTVPAGFRYIAPGLAAAGARPALGVVFGTTNVFSLHGLSGSGNDTPGLLNNIAGAVPAGEHWVAAGDYNREPATWAPPVGNLCPPDAPTRWKSDRKLDYVVRSLAVTDGAVLDLVLSDHYPVVFD